MDKAASIVTCTELGQSPLLAAKAKASAADDVRVHWSDTPEGRPHFEPQHDLAASADSRG